MVVNILYTSNLETVGRGVWLVETVGRGVWLEKGEGGGYEGTEYKKLNNKLKSMNHFITS